MIKKLITTFVCALALCHGAFAIETAAKQAIMVDADTGAVLLNKQADEPMHPSSMSKLMTVYVAFHRLKEGRLNLTDTLPVSEKAWRKQGSKTFVRLGENISVDDLLHGIIVQSGNDACIVLAEGISGSEESFAQEMNRLGKEIGLTHSHFVNATGWPDDNHLMTARDLATLSIHLINDFPEYYPLFAIPQFKYSDITQHNRNPLLGSSLGVDGLKTGHTEAGGYGIALSARQDNRRLVLVINGLSSEKERAEEGKQLLAYGFREFTNRTLLKKGQQVAEADVWFGSEKTVPLVASQDLVTTLPAGDKPDVTFTLKYISPVPAPVTKGAHVADLHIASAGQEAVVVPLHAANDVAKLTGFSKIQAVVKHTLLGK
ncbi:MAG: D-alanyl-D-alanine carboxypeptidase family protein [Alphaproteobacteria bacterium]